MSGMWHHRTVPCTVFFRVGVAASVVFLLQPSAFAQAQARTKARAAVSKPKLDARADPLAELEGSIRAEALAVDGGDPAAIASAARTLNSQALAVMARLRRAEGKPPEAGQAAGAESGKSMAQTESSEPERGSLAVVTPPPAKPAAAQKVARQVQAAAEEKLRKLLASSFNDLGTSEARQRDYPAALHDFQQSEQWDPTNALVLRNLGIAAFRVGDSGEAVRALKLYRAQQTSSGQAVDPPSQLMLALSQFALGKFDDAAASFAPVESLAMQDQRAAYSYAFVLGRTGHAQESNRIADRLVAETLPDDVLPLVCHLYIDAENYEGSQSCYRKALERQPGLALAHYEIGESLLRLDRPSDAIPELRQELLRSPDNPNVLAALGFALLQTSQKAEAQTVLESAVTMHPEHAEAQYELGKLLLDAGNVPAAIPHLEASESADASKDYVHYQLGVAYRKAGRAADAGRELRVYREIKDRNRNEKTSPH